MDDKFLDDLKSFKIQDILEDQRPTTSHTRLTSARPGSRMGASARQAGTEFNTTSISSTNINRSDSSAFSFSFNRPNTSRRENGTTTGSRAPTAFGHSRQNSVGKDGDANGVNRIRNIGNSSARPGSRTMSFTGSGDDEYIPDLDEVMEEDLAMTVASAPLYEIHKMASLKELDAELLQSKPFSIVDGVDVRKLCRFMVPEKELYEPDELWTWDSLYTEITSCPEYSHIVTIPQQSGSKQSESLETHLS